MVAEWSLFPVIKKWGTKKDFNIQWPHKVLLSFMIYSQFSSVAQSCPTLCDPMDCGMPGLSVHHPVLELTHTHVHWVGDVVQPSHPLSFSSPPAFSPSQHEGLFQPSHRPQHIYTMEDYSAIKKERNDAICSTVDGPREYHIKWSQSGRERQLSYITYVRYLKNRYKWTYLQNRNRLTDIEN